MPSNFKPLLLYFPAHTLKSKVENNQTSPWESIFSLGTACMHFSIIGGCAVASPTQTNYTSVGRFLNFPPYSLFPLIYRVCRSIRDSFPNFDWLWMFLRLLIARRACGNYWNEIIWGIFRSRNSAMTDDLITFDFHCQKNNHAKP